MKHKSHRVFIKDDSLAAITPLTPISYPYANIINTSHLYDSVINKIVENVKKTTNGKI